MDSSWECLLSRPRIPRFALTELIGRSLHRSVSRLFCNNMGSSRAVLLLLLVAMSGHPSAAASGWKPVPSARLAATFVGQEMADGVHFAYAFHGQGRFTGVEMGRDVHGTWRVDGDELCWTWIRPRGAEECMTVQRRGRDIRLLRDGGLFLEGSLSTQRLRTDRP